MVRTCPKCGEKSPWKACLKCYLKDSDFDKEPVMEFWRSPFYAVGSFGVIPAKIPEDKED